MNRLTMENKMKFYTVSVEEVHISRVVVEASSPEDARSRAASGEGEEISVDYSHIIGEDQWPVEENDE